VSALSQVVDIVAATRVFVNGAPGFVSDADARWKPFESLYKLGFIKIPGHRILELQMAVERIHAHARFASTSIDEAEKAISHAFQKVAENELAAELGSVQVFAKSSKSIDDLVIEAGLRAEEAHVAGRLCTEAYAEFNSIFPVLKT
jgi:hypothetical protein